MKYGVPVKLRSSFSDVGDWVVPEEALWRRLLSPVSPRRVTSEDHVEDLPDTPGIAARNSHRSPTNISVDMIVQNQAYDGDGPHVHAPKIDRKRAISCSRTKVPELVGKKASASRSTTRSARSRSSASVCAHAYV
jgi:hypothetical protein